MIRIIFCCTLLSLLLSFEGFAQDSAEKYIGYKWTPAKATTYANRIEGAEAKKNLDVFETVIKAESAERADRFKMDIFNGIWFYSISHTWSFPEETDFKLPPFEGQTVTPMTQRTADLLLQALELYKDEIDTNHVNLKTALNSAMVRLTGKGLNNEN